MRFKTREAVNKSHPFLYNRKLVAFHLQLSKSASFLKCSYFFHNSGSRVKLACVNWYGFQLEDLVINGLDRQPLHKIAGRIAELGFNCVRLVYALDVFYENPVGTRH